MIADNNTANNADDEEEQIYILQKIWCHGQSIMPIIIAICYIYELVHDSNSSSSSSEDEEEKNEEATSTIPITMMKYIAPLLLSIWPILSWREIHVRKTTGSYYYQSYNFLRIGGILILMIYSMIVITAISPKKKNNTDNKSSQSTIGAISLLLTIFSILAFIETIAFLLVVTYYKKLFYASGAVVGSVGSGSATISSYHIS